MTYNPNMLVGVDNRTQKSSFLTKRTFNFWIKSGFFFTLVELPGCSSDLTWYIVPEFLVSAEFIESWPEFKPTDTQTLREAIWLLVTTKNVRDWSESTQMSREHTPLNNSYPGSSEQVKCTETLTQLVDFSCFNFVGNIWDNVSTQLNTIYRKCLFVDLLIQNSHDYTVY